MPCRKRKCKKIPLVKSKLVKVNLPMGLLNRGYNCYFNAAMQAISSCPKFVLHIEKLSKKYPILTKLNLFSRIILNLHFQTSKNNNILDNELFKEWNKPGQQDSFELLAFIINKAYNEIRNHTQTTNDLQNWFKVSLPMRMILRYEISCKCGLKLHVPLQSELALHVPIVGLANEKNDLQALTNRYFSDSNIEDFVCDNKDCSFNQAIKSTTLQIPLPNTICIHLQRTIWNGSKMVKSNNFVEFSDILSIYQQFCSSEFMLTENDECPNDNNNKTDFNKNIEIDETQIAQEKICNEMERKLQINDNQIRTILKPRKNSKNKQTNKTRKNPVVTTSSKTDFESKKSSVETHSSLLVDKKIFENQTDPDCKGDLERESQNSDDLDKINFQVSRRNDLDFNKFCEKAKIMKENSSEDYYLKSVIVHCGSLHAGHYVCYRLVDDSWFLVNDSFVMKVNKDEVFKSQAYVLLYEKD